MITGERGIKSSQLITLNQTWSEGNVVLKKPFYNSKLQLITRESGIKKSQIITLT